MRLKINYDEKSFNTLEDILLYVDLKAQKHSFDEMIIAYKQSTGVDSDLYLSFLQTKIIKLETKLKNFT